MITTKVNKTIGLLRKLQKKLPRPVLMTVYKAFVILHLYYGEVSYEEVYNETFRQKLEWIQYNACLALSGALKDTHREKALSNKSPALITITNMGICVVGTSNQLFITGS